MGTVKAASLIFIFVHGEAITYANEGKSGFIYNLAKELISCLSRTNVRVFHENLDRILNSHLLTFKAQITASRMHSSSAETFCSVIDSADPDQTAPIQIRLLLGAV